MKIDAASIQAQWGIALFSFGNVFALDDNKDGKIAPDEAQAHLGMMAEYALARLKLSTAEGACPLQPGDHQVAGRHAIIRFTSNCPLPLAALTIDYRLFFDVDALHRGLLRLEHQGRTYTGIFTSSRAFQEIQLVDVRPWHQFLEYIIEGIWHIWLGFDHLLFSIALLLPAVLQGRGRDWEAVTGFPTTLMGVLTIVTSFTVADSLTLGVAVLGAAAPPPRVVESIIAASVVVAALNNLFPLIPAKRMVALTFGFGLIHGFGFANVLQELGLPPGALVLSLVGFNLGIEMGQLAIVGVVFPWTYALRHLWVYRHALLEFGSAATAGIAMLWFVERAFDLSPLLPIAPGVDLRAELARLGTFALAHLVHPLIIMGELSWSSWWA